MIFPTSPPGGVTDIKLGKYGKLRSNETTKVARAQGPIFLIFVVSRGRCLEGLGMVRQSHCSLIIQSHGLQSVAFFMRKMVTIVHHCGIAMAAACDCDHACCTCAALWMIGACVGS